MFSSGVFIDRYIDVDNDYPILDERQFDWAKIKNYFPIKDYPFIHLNSGSAGVMPQQVVKALVRHITEMNSKPPYEAWKDWQEIKAVNKSDLANRLGVQSDELAVLRNTTEGLNNLIFGIPLQAKDEVVAATHDYPFVINALEQRVQRDQVHFTKLDINLTDATDEEIVANYRNAVTEKTKILVLTHITHREGRILPIKAISDALQKYDVKIILDAAHSFAHFQYKLPNLGVDFMATSLHKWLNAPHGTGLLYIKKERIKEIYPLLSADATRTDFMDKFEYLGTRAFHQEIGITAALMFQKFVGEQRKEERLQHLKQYWTDQVKNLDRVYFCTPLNPQQSCAIASFKMDGVHNLLGKLKKDYKIHAKSVGTDKGAFIRITPNIFTLERDLDVLVDAIHQIHKS